MGPTEKEQRFEQVITRINIVLESRTREWSKKKFWEKAPKHMNSWRNYNQASHLHVLQILAAYYEEQIQDFQPEFNIPCNRGVGNIPEVNIFENLSKCERQILMMKRKDFLAFHFSRFRVFPCPSCNFKDYYDCYLTAERCFGNVIFTEDLQKVLTITPKIWDSEKSRIKAGNKYSFPVGKQRNMYPQHCSKWNPKFDKQEEGREVADRVTEEGTGIKKTQIKEQLHKICGNVKSITIINNWKVVTLFVLIVKKNAEQILRPNLTDEHRQEIDDCLWMNTSDLACIGHTSKFYKRFDKSGKEVCMTLSQFMKNTWCELQKCVASYQLKDCKGCVITLPSLQQQCDDYLTNGVYTPPSSVVSPNNQQTFDENKGRTSGRYFDRWFAPCTTPKQPAVVETSNSCSEHSIQDNRFGRNNSQESVLIDSCYPPGNTSNESIRKIMEVNASIQQLNGSISFDRYPSRFNPNQPNFDNTCSTPQRPLQINMDNTCTPQRPLRVIMDNSCTPQRPQQPIFDNSCFNPNQEAFTSTPQRPQQQQIIMDNNCMCETCEMHRITQQQNCNSYDDERSSSIDRRTPQQQNCGHKRSLSSGRGMPPQQYEHERSLSSGSGRRPQQSGSTTELGSMHTRTGRMSQQQHNNKYNERSPSRGRRM